MKAVHITTQVCNRYHVCRLLQSSIMFTHGSVAVAVAVAVAGSKIKYIFDCSNIDSFVPSSYAEQSDKIHPRFQARLKTRCRYQIE